MNLSKLQLWERFQKYYAEFPTLGLAVDLSRMNFDDNFFPSMEPQIQKAFTAMAELERGAIANPDEKRMVGHYWLRNPALAPTSEIRGEIEQTLAAIQTFVAQVHQGEVKGSGGVFRNLLLIGIGGSALGPQFVAHALGNPATDKMKLFTFDNTDPDGMDRTLAAIGNGLGQTLVVVISKSGGTKETRNGMLEAKAAFDRAGLVFGAHAVAITQDGSELDKYAKQQNWIKRFPMWDWVGGRTSVLSAVGLLPAALQGFDVVAMLAGAKACDEQTRLGVVRENPAAQLALMWFASGNGIGTKSMVILPYKDRLELFSKYLQQLIMESIGKERDLAGNIVHQGISVFGNKGSTDQHAYIQQLRDGLNNFFVTFIEVLKDRSAPNLEIEKGITAGDYLSGFFLGTRQALFENDRDSLTLTIRDVTPFSVGVLIALFERAVGFYASLTNINAYHQPGVEAGKKAATAVIELKLELETLLAKAPASGLKVSEMAETLGKPSEVETVFKLCEHLAANPSSRVVKIATGSSLGAAYRKV
ncbi:MAG: glucose-6-phosphate isomerase [Akkermansiaceae bacterium]|nr:glucose-6-phosphate isomerase [Verrucomicrobiales bacterium]